MKLLKRGTGNELRALRIELNGSLVSYCMRDKIYTSRRFRLHSTSLTSVAFCYKLHLPQLRSRNDILGSHLKVNFKKSDLRSPLYRDYLCSSTTLKKEINTSVCLDCVASVSNWVIARKLERERKKKCEGEGVGSWAEETAFPSLPSLPPSLLLLSHQLSRRTHSETLAIQAIVCPRVFFSCLLLPWEIRCHSIY